MFSALKSMMSRVWDFIPWPQTRQEQKSLTSLKSDVSQEIKKTEKKVRQRLTKEQRQARDNLKKTLASQKKLERERKKIAAAEKKVEREKSLRQRLLTDDEKYDLIQRLNTEAMSNEQRQNIEKKIKGSKLEENRRKRQLKTQAPKKKITDLKSVFERGVTVKQTGNGADGLILKFHIEPRNPKITVNNFLTDARHEAMKLMQKYNSEHKFQMILSTKVKRQRLLGNDTDFRDIFTASKMTVLSTNIDLDEVYDTASTLISGIFYKKEQEGSGWTLEKIYHLELKFYKLTGSKSN